MDERSERARADCGLMSMAGEISDGDAVSQKVDVDAAVGVPI